MFAPPSSIVITGEKSREQFKREKQQRKINARLPKELREQEAEAWRPNNDYEDNERGES